MLVRCHKNLAFEIQSLSFPNKHIFNNYKKAFQGNLKFYHFYIKIPLIFMDVIINYGIQWRRYRDVMSFFSVNFYAADFIVKLIFVDFPFIS